MTTSQNPTSPPDQLTSRRVITADPGTIFGVLADPTQHQHTEPGDWVRGPLPDAQPITEVGQLFGIEMYHENANGRYDIHNKVIAFEPDRVIAWQPGQLEDGQWGSGGWTWRYDLTPAGDSGTDVQLTYDWSAVPEPVREQFGGLPPFPPEFLDESLAAFDRYVTGDNQGTS